MKRTDKPPDDVTIAQMREALQRERDRRVRAEIEVGRLRVELEKSHWRSAFWLADVRHNPGSELIGPLVAPEFLDDPATLRAEVARVTAELIGTHVDTTGSTLTEVAERLETPA